MPVENDFCLTQKYAEKLFIHVYVDNSQRSVMRYDFRPYHELNISRLVRQLLADSFSLHILANRYHRLPIGFIVVPLGPTTAGLGVIPTIYPTSKPDLSDYPTGLLPHPLRLDGFLASSPVALAGKSLSVLEIVRYVANDFGSVHLSRYLRDEYNRLLARAIQP